MPSSIVQAAFTALLLTATSVPDGFADQPEVAAFVGPGQATVSFLPLGKWLVGVVCREDLRCGLFVLGPDGAVEERRTRRLREQLAALSSGDFCARSKMVFAAGDGALVFGNRLQGDRDPRAFCTVRLDPAGDPALTAGAPKLTGREQDLAPSDAQAAALRAFRASDAYRGFVGRALRPPQMAWLSDRWALARVEARAPTVSGCGDQKIFVYDAAARRVNAAMTERLTRSLDEALPGQAPLGCALSLVVSRGAAWLYAASGVEHGTKAAVEIRLGGGSAPALLVKRIDVSAFPFDP